MEGEEDDMTCGDLGNGLGRRPGGVYVGENLQNPYSIRSRKGSGKPCNSLLSAKGAEESDAAALPGPKRNSFYDGSLRKPAASSTRQNSCESNTEMSNEELKQRLQEALEEVEILKVELEACQRQLEGKDEALRILQSMAVFNKATSHTKEMLQKTEEEKRTLEKVREINILQWEIEFDQDRFKNIEDTWTEKYDRIYCENAAFKEALKLRTEEVKTLKAENAILNQQCLEFLAMLDVKQQKVVQENMLLNKSDITDFTGLELAVLGACTCSSSEGQPCPCAKVAALTRKQLLHLKRETENLKKSKDEAFLVADAFRIAFEQQLMQRKDQALRLAEGIKMKKETKFANWRRLRGTERLKLQSNKNNLGQKLSSLLSSGGDCRRVEELDNPNEILKMLIDLVNDKEEALAHQRKVSYMLARALEAKEAVLGWGEGKGLLGLAHACGHSPPAWNSIPSATSTDTHGHPAKPLQKSLSWPLGRAGGPLCSLMRDPLGL
ncbi:PREDICTED: coiled-coil domain-containing protein 125 isoform X1 [Lepidothrix coronata]|uniref:Coiled-coil domain-containing protein 125 isoform X1 n=1 Tax=Lepidothrix coronata TaxID=321398 RepID=A0A6J0HR50_9PASS|nr:PREDICTED: coiled-coil domain-containing protein 125 isoform X1 [Lepidothrix coronata]XP_017676605.1 PREDICTED: coiled-coil domain-containing protein 125 isoform X1 [Lepidothrix coronata]